MIKDDYKTGLNDKLKSIVEELERFKQKKQFNESIDVVDDSVKRLLGLDPKMVNMLSSDDLFNLLWGENINDLMRCIVLAELLNQKAIIYELNSDLTSSFNLYVKSLDIYINTILTDSELEPSDYYNKINGIIDKVYDYELPANTKELLFEYFDLSKNYGNAEDMLYELLEGTNYDEEIVKSGIEFYTRLKDKTEDELAAGNLPLSEVIEGLNKLQNLNKKDN